MKKYKNEIIGGIIIMILLSFGFSNMATTARLWIGGITITDTLSGNARFNNGAMLQDGDFCLEGSNPYIKWGTNGDFNISYSDITKDALFYSAPTAGNKMIFDLNNAAGIYEFKVNGSERFYVNEDYSIAYNQFHVASPAGLVLSQLPNDSLRIADAFKTGTVNTAAGYIKVYVGGSVFYIQLYTGK
jgi:hypothetical protein